MSGLSSQDTKFASDYCDQARYVDLNQENAEAIAKSLEKALGHIKGKVLFYEENGNYFVVGEKDRPVFFHRQFASRLCCWINQEPPHYVHEELGRKFANLFGDYGKELQAQLTTGWCNRKQSVSIDTDKLQRASKSTGRNASKQQSGMDRFVKNIKAYFRDNNIEVSDLDQLIKNKATSYKQLYGRYKNGEEIDDIAIFLTSEDTFQANASSHGSSTRRRQQPTNAARRPQGRTARGGHKRGKKAFFKELGDALFENEVKIKLDKELRYREMTRDDLYAIYKAGKSIEEIVYILHHASDNTPQVDDLAHVAPSPQDTDVVTSQTLQADAFQHPSAVGNHSVLESAVNDRLEVEHDPIAARTAIEAALEQKKFHNSENQECVGRLVETPDNGNSFYTAVAQQLEVTEDNALQQPLEDRVQTLRGNLQELANDVVANSNRNDSTNSHEDFYEVGYTWVNATALSHQVKHNLLSTDGQEADPSFAALVSHRFRRPVEVYRYDLSTGEVVRDLYSANLRADKSPIRLAYDGNGQFYGIRLEPTNPQ